MIEEWKNFEPPFDGYKISNFGRVVSAFGRELKPYKANDRGYTEYRVSLAIKRGGVYIHRKIIRIHLEVFKRFGSGYVEGARIYHIDGNKLNNRIDNLTMCRGYTVAPNEIQLKRYQSDIISCVKHYMKKRDIFSMSTAGLDVDNIIGESCLLAYKHLSQWSEGSSFYAFVRKYTDFAIAREIKKWHKYGFVEPLPEENPNITPCAAYE